MQKESENKMMNGEEKGTTHKFFYPQLNLTVEADNQAEADKKVEEIIANQE